MQRQPARPGRQLEKFYAEYTRLNQKNTSGTITPEEKADLLILRGLERFQIRPTHKIIREHTQAGDIAAAAKEYDRLRKALEDSGFK